MSSGNPRRTPVTRPDAGSANALALKTNMFLRKAPTFHSPTSPLSPDSLTFTPPPLSRSQTNLDDVIDAHRRRVALTLNDIDIDSALSASKGLSASRWSLRDDGLSVPRTILDHTIMPGTDADRRVLRSRNNRREPRYHDSDSGLGTSIASARDKAAEMSGKEERSLVGSSAITRSVAGISSTNEKLPGLSVRATNRIIEHTLKPLLAKPSLKIFHPLLLECPSKIQRKEIVCLRDLEKTLLLIAPERTRAVRLYLEFCLESVRCLQTTVEYLNDREQTRPSDPPYTTSYFIDLVDQIRQYAQQLADQKQKENSGDDGDMDLDISDEIKLHGGITVNGRPAELVRIKKDGKAISIATGLPVELEEEPKGIVRVKRSASEELMDEEEILRSMARRKKNAPPEEYAPKKCREPGCNKEFKRPCDLTKHEKTHSRPWKCPYENCKYHDYGWPTEKEKDRHLNDKHSSNPAMYECFFKPCPYKSKRDSNRKQHMEKAHGWKYVRTKSNGKMGRASNGNSTNAPTPQLQNMPTPSSDESGVATPPQDDFLSPLYSDADFASYIPDDGLATLDIPQELHLDYSPIDNATPSTESSLDNNTAYEDMGQDLNMYDDIYAAPAQVPTPFFSKNMDINFDTFASAALGPLEPAPHISPTGQANAMLFTPTSLADVDEGFEDFPGCGSGSGADFILYPPKAQEPANFNGLFDEMPSLAAGYSQPNTQALFQHMDWQAADYNGFSQS